MSSLACLPPLLHDPSLTSISQSDVPHHQDSACRTFVEDAGTRPLPGVYTFPLVGKNGGDVECPSVESLSYMLQENVYAENPDEALQMHLHLCSQGLEILLGNHLVPLFIKCGNLRPAQQAFNKILQPNLYSWTSLISGYVEAFNFWHALDLFQSMQDSGILPGTITLLAVVKACGRLKLLETSHEIYLQIVKRGYEGNIFLASAIIDMYARCGLVREAQFVFYKLEKRDTIAWNTLIAGFVDNELSSEALQFFHKMEDEGSDPDESSYLYALKACTNLHALELGQDVHLKVIEEGFERGSFIGNTLVDFYGKSGCFSEAEAVLSELQFQNAVPWTALMSAYSDYGLDDEVFQSYKHMLENFVFPNNVTYACILRSCGKIGDLQNMQEIHSFITKTGQELDEHLGNILVDVYASSRCFLEAHCVLDSLLTRDVVSWTALLGGYVEHGFGEIALHYLGQMVPDGISPNSVTMLYGLNACSSVGAFDSGKQLHIEILKMGYESDIGVGNALVDMYARCGSFVEALAFFDMLPVRNVVTWNILITACSDSEVDQEAVHYMEQMMLEGVSPNSVTLSCALRHCTRVAIDRGCAIHIEAVKMGIDEDPTFNNTILSFYAKCGLLLDAQKVLDETPNCDVVAWSALIGGYAEHGFGNEALKLFGEMHLEKVSPNLVTLDSSLKACISMPNAVDNIRRLHLEIAKKGYGLDSRVGDSLVVLYARLGFLEDATVVHDRLLFPSSVSSNALIEEYSRNGHYAEAKQMFNNLQGQDLFSWTALISGCVEQELFDEALYCYEQMQLNGVSPDAICLAFVIQACINLYMTAQGRELYAQIVKQGLEQDLFLGNCLIDMYSKFGAVLEARVIFEKLPVHDIVSWTALATGYAFISLTEEVLLCLKQMQSEHVSPNLVFWNSIIGAFAENEDIEITFFFMLQMQEHCQLPDSWTITSALRACGRAVNLTAGKILHAKAVGSDLIDATCADALIDMYGKCGNMMDGQDLFDSLPSRHLTTWNALIDGYSRQGSSSLVFSLLESMQTEGFLPNETTFLSILMVCGHAGIINIGETVFETMCRRWRIELIVKHFNSMAILLGRAGRLSEALGMLEKMAISPDLITWRSLSASSRLCGDIHFGLLASSTDLYNE